MAVFFGEMQTKADARRMKAVVTVDRGNIRLASGTNDLGEWSLHKVRLEEYTESSILMAVEDEELILFLDEHQRFVGEIGRFIKKPGSERRRPTHPAFRRDEPAGPTIGEELKDDVSREMAPIIREARGWLDAIPRGRPLWIGLGAAVVLYILLPQVIATVALIGGAVALIAGGLAYSDDRLALKIPDPITPVQLVAAGGVAIAIGIVLFLIPWGGVF